MELGARLKEARNAKGMSLEEVQASTKIQKRYLQAIEDNNFDTLPGKFYTRAFIREYASTVGLNPEEVMEEHRSELPSMDEETTIPYTRVQKAKKDTSKQKSSGKPSKIFPAIITVALVIIIAFVIYFFTQQLSTPSETGPETEEPQDEVVISNEEETSGDEENQEEAPEEDSAGEDQQESSGETPDSKEQQDQEKAAEEPEEKQQAQVQLQQTGTGGFPEHTYQVTGAEEKQLSIELAGESYLEVTAPKNGENLIDPIIYTAADSPLTIDVSSYNQVFLKTGSAGALTVSVDGQPLEFPADLTTQKLLINFK
ncbi:helix-turn-helix domain-containing protein [Salimicrobium halophilum]|uniref:Protein RodZ, contains Xre-like HTH and DUF4115 domains n=1 Tax=Salimicrobium halophilum TaxID=86666 RepID=A0A1G8Q7R7_9BACI|nr:helix-turn-helix domain-containing protein [Salimicrobium halophilum]SDJ00613.1 protein RodZ, contains Xre-like HTH and DUF4115 domains [Salimicrobium halophilum]